MSKAAISLAPNSMIGFRPKKRFCALPNSHRRVEAGNTDPGNDERSSYWPTVARSNRGSVPIIL